MSEKKYPCTYSDCNASFDRPYRLASHLLTHSNMKMYKCSESNCSKAYTSNSHLIRHINTSHKVNQNDVIYSCPNCLKRYSNRQNLKRHIKITHTLKPPKPFTCDICKTSFKKKNQLNAHMYQHTGIKSFSCDICSEEFIRLNDKKRHMRNHKTYSCEECQFIFKFWSQYQKHRKIEHINNQEYICNECCRKFKKRDHLVRHLKTHIIRPSFKCPFENCLRTYTRNSNLKQHIFVKHEKITFDCSICGGKLATKSILNKHILVLHNQSEVRKIQPKTKNEGRKDRKDKGIYRISTALKLSGLPEESAICTDINLFTPITPVS